MSSRHAHRGATNPLFVHEAKSSRYCEGVADDIKPEDETSLDKNDDQVDDDEEFREKFNAIKEGADTSYNPMSEALPRLPAYHPAFTKATEYCSDLMNGAALVLKNSEYKDTRIMQLLEKVSRGKSFKYPKPRVVGLIGDSGVGKSSFINALLDTPDIALSGADGGACTNVITEYHQAQPSQNAPFTAEITLFEQDSIQDTLAKHLDWYYRYVHESVKAMDQEELDELKAFAQTTVEVFQDLFADRDEFTDEESTKEFLEQASSASDPKMLQTLKNPPQNVVLKMVSYIEVHIPLRSLHVNPNGLLSDASICSMMTIAMSLRCGR